jgi:hypothetical protein
LKKEKEKEEPTLLTGLGWPNHPMATKKIKNKKSKVLAFGGGRTTLMGHMGGLAPQADRSSLLYIIFSWN